MANKRLNDLPEETDPAADDVVAIDGATTRRAKRSSFLGANIEALRGLTSAADKGIQFSGAGTATTYDLTAAGKALLDDTDAAAQRATLGLVIGTDVQAYDVDLAALAGLTSAADKLPYFTGSGTASLADFTPFGRSLVDDADATAARTTLGLGTAATTDATAYATAAQGATADSALQPSAIGSTVQAYDADLTAFAGKTAPTGAVVGTSDAQTLTNKTLTSPAITTPTGIVKGDVGLGNVDNTADTAKPVSTATQTALDLKANTADLGALALKDTIAVPTDITATGTASATTYLRGDGTWATPAGGGDISGPGSSTSTAIVRWNGTSGTSLSDSASFVDGSGKIGILQASPQAPLHIGAAATVNSINPYVLISRTETRSGVNAHGYSDSSDWNGSTNAAYASYDARITVSGSGTSEHFAGFQSAATFQGTQTTTNCYDFYSAPTVNAGSTLTHRLGVYVANAGGSGTIVDEIGVYVVPLERGSGTNYGLKVDRTFGSGHAGQSVIDGVTIGGSGGDYPSIGYNVTYTTTTGTHKYAGSDYASMIRFGSSGEIQTFTASSGTAGNTISFTAGPRVVLAATAWSAPSDARLKENVETLDVLARLDKFRAVSFKWIDPARYPQDVGVIAQELIECFPEVVNEGNEADPWSVEYDRLGAVALGGVKQLFEMVKDQARQIEDLKAKIKN